MEFTRQLPLNFLGQWWVFFDTPVILLVSRSWAGMRKIYTRDCIGIVIEEGQVDGPNIWGKRRKLSMKTPVIYAGSIVHRTKRCIVFIAQSEWWPALRQEMFAGTMRAKTARCCTQRALRRQHHCVPRSKDTRRTKSVRPTGLNLNQLPKSLSTATLRTTV